RLAVLEARLRADTEGGRQLVGRHFDVFREQPVRGVRLVQRAGEKRLEHERAEARRRGALQRGRVGLVGVGGAKRRHQLERPALGRVGIHPLEMRKVLRILDVAELRIRVRRPCRRRSDDQEKDGPKPHGARPGIDDSKVWVYGCRGCANTSSAAPASTISPSFITITSSDMYRTTARSCEMKR